MPQPFPRQLDNPQFTVGNAMEQRPNLFMSGMAVIAKHSQADAVLNSAMIHLLGTDPEPALIMLTAINNNNIKQKAYIELASDRLNPPDLEIFESVLTACSSADKERNRLAHDLWATEPQLPNSVILISAREFAKIHARIHAQRNNQAVENHAAGELVQAIRRSGLVYDQGDFTRMQRQMSDTFFLVTALSIMLDHATPAHEAEAQRQQLRAVLQRRQ